METISIEPKVKRKIYRKILKTRVKYDSSDIEIIRKRAYEIYLERGAESGNAIDDWTKAELEIKQSIRRERYLEKDIL